MLRNVETNRTDDTSAKGKEVKSDCDVAAWADSLPGMIWFTDENLESPWFNQSWLDFRGRSLNQERQQGLLGGIHPDDSERCWELLLASVATQRPIVFDMRLRGADEKFCPVRCSVAPHFNVNGTLIGYFGNCIDISDLMTSVPHDTARSMSTLLAHEESMRRASAQTIHDQMLQVLFAADMHLQVSTKSISASHPEVAQKLGHARQLLIDVCDEGRKLIAALRPMILDELGLVAAIGHRLAELNLGGAQICAELDEICPNGPFAWESCLFRIFDESVTQLARDNRDAMEVRLYCDRGCGVLEVDSRDTGTSSGTQPCGEVLETIRTRAQIWRGSVHLEPAATGRVKLRVVLPLPKT